MTLLESIQEKARRLQNKIVLPESTEERTLRAADIVLSKGLAQIVLIGSSDEIGSMESTEPLHRM